MTVHRLKDKFIKAFHTIAHGQSVAEAVTLMTGHSVSALIVVKDGTPCGIFTEKDLVRCHTLFPDRRIAETRVDAVMSKDLVVAEPDDSIHDAMGMMIKAGIRHLPVMSEDHMVGMICLEDLVHTHVGELTRELHYLKDYITDLQDAAHD